MGRDLRVFDPKKSRFVFVGTVDGKVFTRQVERKHFVFKYRGYGLQEELFKQLFDIDTINLVRGSTILRSKRSDWVKHGVVDDLGHGLQRFLNRKHMELIDINTPRLI